MSKKLFGIIASFALVLSLVGATTASALTAADIAMLQAAGIINATQAASLSASIASTPVVSSGYTFAKDLTVGSRGADVTALQNLLGVSPATGYFGSLTKAAVIKYQLSKGITPAAGYFGAKTRGVVNASAPVSGTTGTTGTVNVTGTDLKVSLAATSPAQGTMVRGQSIADLAEYTFTNTSATPAVVTNVTLQRGGVSNDAALTNVYLYNGVTRLTDAASISQGKIAFNAPTGLFTVPAGSSMTVAVRSDIYGTDSAYDGQTFVISLTGVQSNLPVSAVYPVSGAAQSISNATLAGVTVASTSPAATTIDPQTDYVMWAGTINVTNNDSWLKAIALRQVGSVANGDLNNFRFYVDGVQVGATLAAYDANGYLTFDFSASPVKLTATSHIVKLIGDVVGGSTKTFSFSLRQASDVNVVDSQLNVNVLATATGNFPLTTGDQKVSSGSLTITKTNDSPSGNVTLSASNVSLGKFQLKASGEPVKVEKLTVSFTGSNIGPLRNGALYANGVQIGSTASIGSTTATDFTLGSSLVVYPGTPVTLEVKSDVYAASGAAVANGNVITVTLKQGSSNGDLQKSLGLVSVPTADVSGNQLTVTQGSMTLSKVSSYSNQAVIAPQTSLKLGSYALTAGTTEDLLINTITVNFLGSAASSSATSSITDLHLTFGDGSASDVVSSNKSTIVSGDNSFAVNYTIPAGQTRIINVYGTVASTFGGADVINTKLQVAAQTSRSTQTVTAPSAGNYTTGQTISMTTGALNIAQYNLQSDKNVVANTLVPAGSFKFVATGDTFTIDQLIGDLPTFASAGNVGSVIYKINGQTINGAGTGFDTSNGSAARATTTGLNIVVPANSSAGVVVDAYLQLNSVGTPNNATSSSNVKFGLIGYRKQSSTGVQTPVGGQTTMVGNNQYAYASVPTITTVALPNTSLQNGDQVVAKINIAADANGAIDWSKIVFTVNRSDDAVSLGAVATDWKVKLDGVAVSGLIATSTDLASTTNNVLSGTVSFTPATIEQIGAGTSKTYELWTSVAGVTTSQSVTSKVAQGATAHAASAASTTAATAAGTASFVWSDESYNTTIHSATTPDWNNDWLVKNLPTATQVMSI